MRTRIPLRFERGRIMGQLLETHVLFPVFAILLLFVVWLVAGRLIRVEGAAAERKAADSARELVEVYEAQMIRNLASIDQTLRTIKYAYEHNETPATLVELDKKGLLPPRLVFTVSIANRSGEILASSSSAKQTLSVALPYFRDHQKDDSTTTKINLDLTSSSEPRLQFSRRLNGEDGSFQGIAIVSVEPAYFTSGYERSRLGDEGVLGLIENGIFLAKRSGEQVTAGEIASEALQKISAEENADSVLEVHAGDGVPRYVNVRQLYGYPLTVMVGLSQAEQLDAFQQKKNYYLWAAGVASILLVMLGAMLGNLSWQLAQSRKRTQKNQETYYAASEASIDAFFVLRVEKDHAGKIVDFVVEDINNRGAEIFGKAKAELVGARLCDAVPECRDNGVLAEFIDVFKTGIVKEVECKNSTLGIHAEWLYRQAVRVEDGVVVILRDISERKTIEARISYMAHHDALTGLPNRALLDDRINQALLRAKRQNKCVTLAFIDLDGFKPVNDRYGHKVGDELLKTVATRMVNCLRQTDTVGRLGGDEFVIVLGEHPEEGDSLEPTLDKVRNAIAEPIYIKDLKLTVTASMGVVKYPRDGDTSDALLMHADVAMYMVKARGRNNYLYYEMWMGNDTASVPEGG